MILDDFEIDGFRIVADASLRPIQRLTAALAGRIPTVCVDIGASDGLICNNTLFLYLQGWQGLSLEASPQAFVRMQAFYSRHLAQVQLGCTRVTPANIGALLAAAEIPAEFGFLSLDIDSYDYEVLAALLRTHRPAVICAEINEKIPPPIHFHVAYREDHRYQGDHFYGMSLSALSELGAAHDYLLLELCFNNALLVRRELSPWPGLSPEAAYAAGYLAGPMPDYNADMQALQSLDPESAIACLQAHFGPAEGRYVCRLA